VVIFLTDGRPTIGTTDENQIVAESRSVAKATLASSVSGIGNRRQHHLLDKITEELTPSANTCFRRISKVKVSQLLFKN